jgi:hypothetical protein
VTGPFQPGASGTLGPESAPEDGPDPVCVLDAVVCVHFAGANLNRELIAALRLAGWVVLVPEEVCAEILGKDAKYPGLAKRWAALQNSPHIRVLPALRLGDHTQARVVEIFESLRAAEFEQAISKPKDLGECVVVAHGVHLSEQGHDVTLLMDDHGGLVMAAEARLTCATIEDVLALAVHAGCFPRLADVRAAYRKLQRFGSGLPDFARTALAGQHRDWLHATPALPGGTPES